MYLLSAKSYFYQFWGIIFQKLLLVKFEGLNFQKIYVGLLRIFQHFSIWNKKLSWDKLSLRREAILKQGFEHSFPIKWSGKKVVYFWIVMNIAVTWLLFTILKNHCKILKRHAETIIQAHEINIWNKMVC